MNVQPYITNNTRIIANFNKAYGTTGTSVLFKTTGKKDSYVQGKELITDAHVQKAMLKIQKENRFLDLNNKIITDLSKQYGTEAPQAIAQILGNVNPYLKGKKHISSDHIQKIITLVQTTRRDQPKLKKEIDDYNNVRKDRVRAWIHDHKKSVNPAKDYIEVLAHHVAYVDWNPGDKIPYFGGGEYIVEKMIKNEKGLHIVVLIPSVTNPPKTPSGKSPKPVMAIRGSVNFESLIDDFKEVIGKRSLNLSIREVEETLTSITSRFGPALLCGHSLGGAICQHLVADYCDKLPIDSCHLFSSPGCGDESANKFAEKLKRIPETHRTRVYLYRNDQDLVPHGGGPHLKNYKGYVAANDRSKFAYHKRHETHMNLEFFRRRADRLTKEFDHKVDKFFANRMERIRKIAALIILPLTKFFSSAYRLRKNKVRIERYISGSAPNQKSVLPPRRSGTAPIYARS